MGKKLVIVESPAKARTINKILGKEFIVKASMGHVRDLPQKKLGVDVEKGFLPEYISIKGRSKVIKELKEAAAKSDAIYLAPDPDREGEAIAWHLKEILKDAVDADQLFRVSYNEITASAIQDAFANPRMLDMKKVDSQQARRILDRIVGYKVSPLLWRRIRGGSSAGRVQSVALRLVCEREKEIRNFVVEKFWLLGAKVRKFVDPRDPFAIRLTKVDGEKADIRSEEDAQAIIKGFTQRPFEVKDIQEKIVRKRARPPFITSTLQQAASGACSFSPSRTMRIAQGLYEGVDLGDGPTGLITYMRTDSFNVAQGAVESCRAYIEQNFGSEYMPDKPNRYKSRGSAQEAHEAIRPTDVTRSPESLCSVLSGEQMKLYKLIWQRFVASQMSPAQIKQRSAEFEAIPPAADAKSYLFRASASEVVFQGYMKVTGAGEKTSESNADNDDGETTSLPPLEIGEKVEFLEAESTEKETQPPARYTEASLVRALEENGVGRPSTYAQILSTLQQRKYVNREKRSLVPTDTGLSVNEFLIEHLPKLFDVHFTAEMEESLDEIERGSVEWTNMLQTFYEHFLQWLEDARGPKADKEQVARILDILEQVKEWNPPQKRGKRTYSDEKFAGSIRKQMESDKAISEVQEIALLRLVAQYKEQLPGAEETIMEMGLDEKYKEATKAAAPPLEDTKKKLELLAQVNFDEPRTVGKRTYDDSAFVGSLRDQVQQQKKKLSDRQKTFLDRLLRKYADQLGGLEKIAETVELAEQEEGASTDELDSLFAAAENIKEWRDPVQRGKRTWDDHEFYNSLVRQYKQKRTLSPRQAGSLKKMLQRYAAQIPNYNDIADKFGLKPLAEKAPADKE